jgi:hypothetical protein
METSEFLYFIAFIVSVGLAIWFIVTLNAIKRNLEYGNKLQQYSNERLQDQIRLLASLANQPASNKAE